MAYTAYTWQTSEVITADKLNALETATQEAFDIEPGITPNLEISAIVDSTSVVESPTVQKVIMRVDEANPKDSFTFIGIKGSDGQDGADGKYIVAIEAVLDDQDRQVGHWNFTFNDDSTETIVSNVTEYDPYLSSRVGYAVVGEAVAL